MAKSYEQALARLVDGADLNEKKAIINKIASTNQNLVESLAIKWLKDSKMLVGNIGKCQAYLPLGIYIEGWFFPTNRYDSIEIFSGDKYIANAMIGEYRGDVYNNFSFFNESNAGFHCFITEHLQTIEKNGQITLLVRKDGKIIKKIEQSIVCYSIEKSLEEIKENLHEQNNILVPTLTNQMKRLIPIAKQMPEYNFVTLIEGMQDSIEEAIKYCINDGLSEQDINVFFMTMVPDILKRNNAPRLCEMDLSQMQLIEYDKDELIGLAAKNFQTKYRVSKEYAIGFCLECLSYSKQLIKIINPKMIIIWNKFSPWHLMLEFVANEFSIPVVYMENGVLPGTLIFETEGQMGESYPAIHSDEFSNLIVDDNEIHKAEIIWKQLNKNKLNRWISADKSVYKDGELEKVKNQLNPEWPTLLYAGQNDFESGIYPYTKYTQIYHSPIFESSEETAIYLGKLADKNHWNLIYKRHPMMRGKLVAELPGNVIVNDNINIHDAIDISDLVVTILSQTSYVSLIRKKPALMLGYHQLSHKGCVYETDEKDKIESKIFEALENGFTDIQRENFKKHIAQLCKYYLYRDFANDDISYGKGISDLVYWFHDVINDSVQTISIYKKDENIEIESGKKIIEKSGRFTLKISLKERIFRKNLKICLSNHERICSIICNSVFKGKYEDIMMLISQIAPQYLYKKNWEQIFFITSHSFISKGEEKFEEFLILNNELNEEIRNRLKVEKVLRNVVKSYLRNNRAVGIRRAFNTNYSYTQKLFLEELNYFIFNLVDKKELNSLYELIDNCELNDINVSYTMELIFKNNYFDNMLMKKWMQVLLNSNNLEILYYFGLLELDRILFVYPQSIYDDYYIDRNFLLKKISKLLNSDRKWIKKKKNNVKTLAMLVVGLHGKNFASTRLQVGLANRLNAIGWKITIYVADTNYITTDKKFVVNPIMIRRNFSKEIYQKDHWLMIDSGVEVRYFNQQEDGADRYYRLINSIYEDNPQAIIDITNEQGIYNIQLIKDFPVISIPLNGYTTSSTASCYIARNINYVHKLEEIYGKVDADNLAEANLYLPYPIEKEHYERKNFGFAEKDILVVTVGNRLNYEITKEIQKRIKVLLSENYKLKWIIVGNTNKNAFSEMKDEIINKQVILWGYESNLYKLYKICDIYLDLPRSGGAGATAFAVQCGLPAIIVRCYSDILSFLGEENAVKSFDESLVLLRQLIKSKVKRRQINKAEYKRLMSEKFSIKNFTKIVENEILRKIGSNEL